MALKSSLHKARPENKWITCVRGAPSSGGRAKLYELLLLRGYPPFRTCFHLHPSCRSRKNLAENILLN